VPRLLTIVGLNTFLLPTDAHDVKKLRIVVAYYRGLLQKGMVATARD